MQNSYWLLLATFLGAMLAALLVVTLATSRRRRPSQRPLPTEWALTARPVFSTDERRVYRQLREALPHHVVLAKLPLVRFCQPIDSQEVRYWYELLGTIHVAFAICSPNGRVLAVVDLDSDRLPSRRVLQIKQSVLSACRVRYLRCPPDHLPTVPELQLLVPQSAATSRGPQPAPTRPVPYVRDALTPASMIPRRKDRATALWQDSNMFQDSFFASDSRGEGFGGSEFSTLSPSPSSMARSSAASVSSDSVAAGEEPDDDIAGMVVDANHRYGSQAEH